MAESVIPSQFSDDEYLDDVALQQRAAARARRLTASLDMYLVLTVGILIAIGLMMVWSTTFYWSEPQSKLFLQQLQNVVIGIGVMITLGLIDYRVWRKLAVPIMGILIAALFLLLLQPESARVFGAKRAFLNGAVQPSEAAPLVTVIYMAAWLASKQTKLRKVTYGLLPFGLLVGGVAGLILLQPDLDPAALILITASAMFFLAGADWIQIGLVALAFVVAGIFAVGQLGYARERVNTFIDLLTDPVNANANHAQNVIISFLNGGLTGVGLGESRQKFELLQTPHTDSIFAVIGEELGLVGCALVVGLYVSLMLRGFKIARAAPDMFGSLLAAGLTLSIVLKAMFNVAVMASIIPFAGVPLPFISFGGSALISAMAHIGLLLSISRVTMRKAAKSPTRKVNEMLMMPGGRSAAGMRIQNQD